MKILWNGVRRDFFVQIEKHTRIAGDHRSPLHGFEHTPISSSPVHTLHSYAYRGPSPRL